MDSQQLETENPNHCYDVLEPWLVETMPRSSLRWRWEMFLNWFHWRGKIIKKHIKALIGSSKRSVKNYRTADHVKNTYGRTWSSVVWPHPRKPKSRKDRTLAEWNEKGLVLTREGINFVHLERVMKVVDLTKPSTVLEVGAGMGLNLLTLSCCFPGTKFAGVELTAEGVARAKSVQEEDTLPDVIASFSVFELKDRTAHKTIDFRQGDATRLPFDDNSFDLVFSRLALEQMELIRDQAISEMVRVSKKAVLMVEPFADFNLEGQRPLAIRAKNYFSLSTQDVQKYDLELMAVFGNWPQKISEGAGLAYYHLK